MKNCPHGVEGDCMWCAPPGRHHLVGGEIVTNVHDLSLCVGTPCCIHNPSPHHMVQWRQHWRGDTGVMERTCTHGVGHPDPDQPFAPDAWQWTHGCDGCCQPPF